MTNKTVDLEARSVFVDRYCAAKAWDARNLSWEQILEIRSQPEWNDPSALPQAKEETVVKRVGASLFIYEEGEFCCVCKATVPLGRYGFQDTTLEFTVCNPCKEGDGFRNWLAAEFERVMIVHDENVKLPDGKWRIR